MRADVAPDNKYADETTEDAVYVSDALQIIRRRLWAIALTAVVCVILAVAYSLYQTPMYEGTILILVDQEESGEANVLNSDVQGLEQLAQTMVRAINTRTVAEAVIEELNLNVDPDDFLANLSVEQAPETQFVEVRFTDPDPERAARVANTVGEVFSERISEVNPSASAVVATLWESAAVPEAPVSPDPVRNGLLGLMIGLVLGIGLAFVLEYRDNSWRSPEEAEQVLGVVNFGVVPAFEVPKDKGRKG